MYKIASTEDCIRRIDRIRFNLEGLNACATAAVAITSMLDALDTSDKKGFAES